MRYFKINEEVSDAPSNANFILHTHDSYEILLFLEGDTNYIVEGKSYKLRPGDMMLIRKHQLHRALHNTPARYRRVLIYIEPEFFVKYHCKEYERQFLNNSLEMDNLISAEMVKQTGILDAIHRLRTYTNKFKDTATPICISCLTELMYLINKTNEFAEADLPNKQLAKIIEYLNEHFSEDLTLDGISEKFFISKYYLCREFKLVTGMTFHQYLNQKRFAQVKDLVSSGTSINNAAVLSGFRSYPAFYRAYLNEYGIKPSSGLKS